MSTSPEGAYRGADPATNPDDATRTKPNRMPADGHRIDNHESTTETTSPDRPAILDRQKERFGGIKWGSAFFGWLTATGTALILTALAAAGGTAFGLANNPGGLGQAAGQAAQNPAAVQTAGIVSAIVVLVILLIAYYCGGYVAGRMARFNGMKQGVAVWIWAIIIAAVVAILTVIAGSQFTILANLNGLPRLPIDAGTLTTGGIIAAAVALVASLVGALLGGLAGMRYHRKIDRADFDQ